MLLKFQDDDRILEKSYQTSILSLKSEVNQMNRLALIE